MLKVAIAESRCVNRRDVEFLQLQAEDTTHEKMLGGSVGRMSAGNHEDSTPDRKSSWSQKSKNEIEIRKRDVDAKRQKSAWTGLTFGV